MCGRGLCRHAQAVRRGNGPETKPHPPQSPRLEHSPARTPADSKHDVVKMLGGIVHTLGGQVPESQLRARLLTEQRRASNLCQCRELNTLTVCYKRHSHV